MKRRRRIIGRCRLRNAHAGDNRRSGQELDEWRLRPGQDRSDDWNVANHPAEIHAHAPEQAPPFAGLRSRRRGGSIWRMLEDAVPLNGTARNRRIRGRNPHAGHPATVMFRDEVLRPRAPGRPEFTARHACAMSDEEASHTAYTPPTSYG